MASKKKEEKKMAAPAKPINNIQVEFTETEYNKFIDFATKKKTSFTPEEQKIREKFQRQMQNRGRKR